MALRITVELLGVAEYLSALPHRNLFNRRHEIVDDFKMT